MPHNAWHFGADADTNGVPGWLTGAYDAVTPSEALNRWYRQVAQQPGLAGPYADLLRQRGPNLLSRYFTYGPQDVGQPGYDFIDFAKGAGEWGGGNITQENYAQRLREQAGNFDVLDENLNANQLMRRDTSPSPAMPIERSLTSLPGIAVSGRPIYNGCSATCTRERAAPTWRAAFSGRHKAQAYSKGVLHHGRI